MNIRTLISSALIVGGGWLATGFAWAESPFPVPEAGGVPAFSLFPATGQTSCWDTFGNLIACDGTTGQDGDIQAGRDLSYTDTGLTIIDNNTKLEWIKQDDNNNLGEREILFCETAQYPDYLDNDCEFTWYQAFVFVAKLNTVPCFAGHCDWRVPNYKELVSILNLENTYPAVSAEFNTGCEADCEVGGAENACSCTAANDYWSSTSDANYPFWAWLVDFRVGDVNNVVKSTHKPVRAVRGGL